MDESIKYLNDMTDEQIKKIAKKYAEYRTKPLDDETNKIVLEYFNNITFLRWLSKTYCIVEKSKIAEMYAGFKLNVFRSYSEPATILVKACTVDVAKVNLLEYLFGKELFSGKENKE